MYRRAGVNRAMGPSWESTWLPRRGTRPNPPQGDGSNDADETQDVAEGYGGQPAGTGRYGPGRKSWQRAGRRGGRRVCHGGPATAVRASPTAPGAAAPGRLLWCAYSRRARRRSGCGGAMSAPAPAGPTSPTVADVRRVLGIVVHADPGPLRAGAPRCSCSGRKADGFSRG